MVKSKNKVFIPLTLDNSTKTTLTDKQIVLTAVILLVWGFSLLVLFIHHSNYNGIYWHASKLFCIPMALLATYIATFVFRKVIIKEDQLLKVYALNKSKEITDIGFMWDIFDVKDGKLYYTNGMVGAIVDVQHGYVFDRPENHPELHRATIKKAIADVANRGYNIQYFNREEKDTNLGPISKTEKLLRAERGSQVYNLGMDILNHTKAVCKDIATLEHEYFLIVATDMRTVQNIDQAVEEFMSNLHGGLYSFIRRLNGQEILNWVQMLYGLNFIDTNQLMNSKFRFDDLKLISVVEEIRDESQTRQTLGNDEDISDDDQDMMAEFERMLQSANSQSSSEEDIIE